MKPSLEKHWHHLPQEELLDLLDTDSDKGLDRFEVAVRQQNFGTNALILAGSQKDFPVMDNDNVVGVFTQSGLLKGLLEHGDHTRVEDCMQWGMPNAKTGDPLKEVLQRLQACQCRLLSAIEAGKLMSTVNMDNIMELIAIQKALHEEHKHALASLIGVVSNDENYPHSNILD